MVSPGLTWRTLAFLCFATLLLVGLGVYVRHFRFILIPLPPRLSQLFRREEAPPSDMPPGATPTSVAPSCNYSVPVDSGEDIWRDFGLYLRMFHGGKGIYESMLRTSMKYFWSVPSNITIVLDNTPQDRAFGEEIAGKFPFPRICYEKKYDPKYYHGNGHNFMQLSMLYPEHCFDKKYIGFVDTDTFFTTSITPELLFNGNKPRVIGLYGTDYVKSWPKQTEFLFKRKEVFKCMTYFPVVMKLEHIIEMRQHLEKLHNKTFLELFQKVTKKHPAKVSQFNLMCNYAWYFHSNEYEFHAQIKFPNFKWDKPTQLIGRQPREYYRKHVTAQMQYPFPRASVHLRWHPTPRETDPRDKPRMLRDGLCYSGGATWCPELCAGVNTSALQRELFVFEDTDWRWRHECAAAQQAHYDHVVLHMTPSAQAQIVQGCTDMRAGMYDVKRGVYKDPTLKVN